MTTVTSTNTTTKPTTTQTPSNDYHDGKFDAAIGLCLRKPNNKLFNFVVA